MDGTRRALIVASDSYADPGLRQLRAPASDARALATVLGDPEIGDFEVRTLLNKPAHGVTLAIEELFADCTLGDLLVVYFSCHGIKDEDGELYFATSNTALGRLASTAVPAEFVSRRMNRARSRRVVLLLDCCYAGAFERGLVARAGTDIGIEHQLGGRGRAVITASSAMEYAFEAGELTSTQEVPPSVFTSALVEGLETGDADRDLDGRIGLDELYSYVYDKVRAATPNQTPGKWVLGMEGELYIARRRHPVTTPAPLTAELQAAVENPLPGIRTAAVAELVRVLQGNHAGRVLAARQALEQLTRDDSRMVAGAATAALGNLATASQLELPRPDLALSATEIDFGSLPQHGQSPEQRIRVTNAGGGDLNARATASARWLRLRHTDDELAVTVDTSEAGNYRGTITIDSDGGTATIRVHAQVDPEPPVAPPASDKTPDTANARTADPATGQVTAVQGPGHAAVRKDMPAVQVLLPAAAARQAGQEFELGGLLNVRVKYGRTPRALLGRDLCVLSAAGLLAALATDEWVLAGLAGAMFAAASVVIVICRRKRPVESWVARYQDGFAQLLLPGNLRVVRWARVTKVIVTFRIARGGGTMNSPPSTSVTVIGFYAWPCLTQFEPQIRGTSVARGVAAALAADALRAVGPRLTAAFISAYDTDGAAVFGQVRIDQSGITLMAGQGSPAGLVRWSEIRSVIGHSTTLPDRRKLVYEIILHCESKPKYRSIDLAAVPNGIFLPAVVRHAATRHGIPTRL